jgi:hypothetical protein
MAQPLALFGAAGLFGQARPCAALVGATKYAKTHDAIGRISG